MRFTLIAIGSTGDVRPYLCLGRELRRRGHDVTLCAFADFEAEVTAEGFRFAPLCASARTFMDNMMRPGVPGVGFIKEMRGILHSVIRPLLRDLPAACEDADVIVSTYFGDIPQSIAEKRGVPFIQTHYYPMDSNGETPIASAPGQSWGRAWCRASYRLGYLLISTLERVYVRRWRQEEGMPPRRLDTGPHYEINGHTVPVLYAMSQLLMPRPREWAANIHMTGFWLDGRAPEYTPDPELAAFLAAGEKPIYVGFGSMLSGDMQQTLRIILQAIRCAGVRAVISSGWGGVDIPPQRDVYVAGFVPHAWLFGQVAAVVHHGGSGTTVAGVLAKLPTLVIPFGGDQTFWAMRVRMLGLGPKPIPREKLTVARLTRALHDLTTVSSYRMAAQALGERLRLENGVGTAADLIEREVVRWRQEDGPSGVPPGNPSGACAESPSGDASGDCAATPLRFFRRGLIAPRGA